MSEPDEMVKTPALQRIYSHEIGISSVHQGLGHFGGAMMALLQPRGGQVA